MAKLKTPKDPNAPKKPRKQRTENPIAAAARRYAKATEALVKAVNAKKETEADYAALDHKIAEMTAQRDEAKAYLDSATAGVTMR